MRQYSATAQAYFASRNGYVARILFWVKARNRTTGAEELLGLWNGDEDRNFVIGGQTRLYYRAGAMLRVPPITTQTGTGVRVQRLTVSPISDPVAQLLRGYDPRLAPVEMHRALFDPLTGLLIEEPHRVYKGAIDAAPIPTAKAGGEAMSEISLVSAARSLTKTSAQKKSDNTQRLRGGDRLHRYIDVSGSVEPNWGG